MISSIQNTIILYMGKNTKDIRLATGLNTPIFTVLINNCELC